MEINLSNKNEVLDRLEHLRDLVYRSDKYRQYAETGCYQESLEKIHGIQQDLGALPRVPSVYSNMPVFPTGQEDYEKAKALWEKWRLRLLIAGAATAVFVVIYFISHKSFFNIIATIGILATVFIWYLQHTAANEMKIKKKTYDGSLERYNKTIGSFRSSLAAYAEEAKAGAAAAKEYGEKCRTAYAAYDTVLSELVQSQEEASAKFTETFEEFKRLNFLPGAYEHLIPNLITLLKSGRADSYKEALNIAIQEEKEEAAEAARRAEDERRTQILAAQAAEEQRHNAAMERAEQDRAKAEQERAQAEKDRANAEERARRNAQKADSEARANASRQCMVCAKRSGCRNPYVPGCGAFVPRK